MHHWQRQGEESSVNPQSQRLQTLLPPTPKLPPHPQQPQHEQQPSRASRKAKQFRSAAPADAASQIRGWPLSAEFPPPRISGNEPKRKRKRRQDEEDDDDDSDQDEGRVGRGMGSRLPARPFFLENDVDEDEPEEEAEQGGNDRARNALPFGQGGGDGFTTKDIMGYSSSKIARYITNYASNVYLIAPLSICSDSLTALVHEVLSDRRAEWNGIHFSAYTLLAWGSRCTLDTHMAADFCFEAKEQFDHLMRAGNSDYQFAEALHCMAIYAMGTDANNQALSYLDESLKICSTLGAVNGPVFSRALFSKYLVALARIDEEGSNSQTERLALRERAWAWFAAEYRIAKTSPQYEESGTRPSWSPISVHALPTMETYTGLVVAVLSDIYSLNSRWKSWQASLGLKEHDGFNEQYLREQQETILAQIARLIEKYGRSPVLPVSISNAIRLNLYALYAFSYMALETYDTALQWTTTYVSELKNMLPMPCVYMLCSEMDIIFRVCEQMGNAQLLLDVLKVLMEAVKTDTSVRFLRNRCQSLLFAMNPRYQQQQQQQQRQQPQQQHRQPMTQQEQQQHQQHLPPLLRPSFLIRDHQPLPPLPPSPKNPPVLNLTTPPYSRTHPPVPASLLSSHLGGGPSFVSSEPQNPPIWLPSNLQHLLQQQPQQPHSHSPLLSPQPWNPHLRSPPFVFTPPPDDDNDDAHMNPVDPPSSPPLDGGYNPLDPPEPKRRRKDRTPPSNNNNNNNTTTTITTTTTSANKPRTTKTTTTTTTEPPLTHDKKIESLLAQLHEALPDVATPQDGQPTAGGAQASPTMVAGVDATTDAPPQPGPKRCTMCNTANTPEWRKGPDGPRTLCNACGLRYRREVQAREANTTQQCFTKFTIVKKKP